MRNRTLIDMFFKELQTGVHIRRKHITQTCIEIKNEKGHSWTELSQDNYQEYAIIGYVSTVNYGGNKIQTLQHAF